ncbi:dihydroxyacetone kinase subunit DhaL, partial [uncultured Acinetobacter sp.]|uniref:dihydroxyacetone kinase subunit DhaL n=1 Tax=uncultured Acinetobacter sp. TaxID=165433 RepID=UPI002592D47D
AQKAADNVTSLGFAFNSCTVPAKGTPTFSLAEDEMEYGVGIHGEPGIRREKILPSNELAQRIVDDLFLDRPELKEVAVLINGFGSTPMQELYVFNQDVCQQLAAKGIKIYRSFVGNFMTSIDMAGASVSLLELDDELKAYLDAEANTPAFKMDGSAALPVEFAVNNAQAEQTLNTEIETHAEHATIVDEQFSIENMRYVIDAMSACIIKNEVPFCELDAHAGDGDFGMSVAKGFKQLKRHWVELTQYERMDDFLLNCSMIIMEHCGGASGPIWGSAFRAASKSIKGKDTLSVADFAALLQDAVKGIQTTGERSFGRGAVVGDKTLIDALVPCADSWSANTDKSFKENFTLGAQAAVQGAENTKAIVARMGRAGTVGDRSLGYPDAGAHGLGVIFSEIATLIK